MPYVYILKSKNDEKYYFGSTKNIVRRLKEYKNGQVPSTKNRRPLRLIGWRKFESIFEAVMWEKKYKNSHGQFERDIKNGKITIYS